MSFISRFLKPKKGEDALEETEEILEKGGEEGLFMPTGGKGEEEALLMSPEPQGGRPAEEGEATAEEEDSDALSPSEAPQGEAAMMDPEEAADRQSPPAAPLEAAQGGAVTSGPEEIANAAAAAANPPEASAGQETSVTAEPAEQESTPEEARSDEQEEDPMAAFRTTTVESEAGGLTKEIDDTPIGELLTDLREVRSMLPTAPAAVDGGAGGDIEG